MQITKISKITEYIYRVDYEPSSWWERRVLKLKPYFEEYYHDPESVSKGFLNLGTGDWLFAELSDLGNRLMKFRIIQSVKQLTKCA